LSLHVVEAGVKIGFQHGLIIFKYRDGKVERYDPHEVSSLIVSANSSISRNVLTLLNQHGIELIFLTDRGLPIATLRPYLEPKDFEVWRLQLSLPLVKANYLAKQFALASIKNMMSLLRALAWKRIYSSPEVAKELRRLVEEIHEFLVEAKKVKTSFRGKPTTNLRQMLKNLEAKAGKRYYTGISKVIPSTFNFKSRLKNNPDPFNSILSYARGLIRMKLHNLLMVNGVNPYIGFLHTQPEKEPSLTWDFSENWIIDCADRICIKLAVRKIIKPEKHFLKPKGKIYHLNAYGKKLLASACLNQYEQRLPEIKENLKQLITFFKGQTSYKAWSRIL